MNKQRQIAIKLCRCIHDDQIEHFVNHSNTYNNPAVYPDAASQPQTGKQAALWVRSSMKRTWNV